MKKDEIRIVDSNWLSKFLMIFARRSFEIQGMVQFEKVGNKEVLTVCGDSVKWLDNLVVETYSGKRADELFFEWLNKKYPEYIGYIQLF